MDSRYEFYRPTPQLCLSEAPPIFSCLTHFPPTMNFCFFNLSFLFCPCAKSTAVHGSEENSKTLAVRSVFPHNSHSGTFLLFLFPPPLPLKHPPPCWGWRAVGACFRSPPFLTAEHELCHSEHMSFTGTALNSILSIQGLLRSGNIWGIYRDHWQPWQNQLLRHGVSLYWLGQDRIYSIMVHYKFYTTA